MRHSIFLTMLLLLHQFNDTEAIKKDGLTDEQTDKQTEEKEQQYTIYEQVTDLLELMDNFDREVICQKLNQSSVEQLKSEGRWTVKFGKVFELLRQIVCTEGIMP